MYSYDSKFAIVVNNTNSMLMQAYTSTLVICGTTFTNNFSSFYYCWYPLLNGIPFQNILPGSSFLKIPSMKPEEIEDFIKFSLMQSFRTLTSSQYQVSNSQKFPMFFFIHNIITVNNASSSMPCDISHILKSDNIYTSLHPFYTLYIKPDANIHLCF